VNKKLEAIKQSILNEPFTQTLKEMVNQYDTTLAQNNALGLHIGNKVAQIYNHQYELGFTFDEFIDMFPEFLPWLPEGRPDENGNLEELQIAELYQELYSTASMFWMEKDDHKRAELWLKVEALVLRALTRFVDKGGTVEDYKNIFPEFTPWVDHERRGIRPISKSEQLDKLESLFTEWESERVARVNVLHQMAKCDREIDDILDPISIKELEDLEAHEPCFKEFITTKIYEKKYAAEHNGKVAPPPLEF
jgi:hypothetical protein